MILVELNWLCQGLCKRMVLCFLALPILTADCWEPWTCSAWGCPIFVRLTNECWAAAKPGPRFLRWHIDRECLTNKSFWTHAGPRQTQLYTLGSSDSVYLLFRHITHGKVRLQHMEKPISNTWKALLLDFLSILPRFLQETECIFLKPCQEVFSSVLCRIASVVLNSD